MKIHYILFAFLLASCSSPVSNEASMTPSVADEKTVTLTEVQMKNAGIAVGKPEVRDLHATLKVNGVIDVPPQNLVSVSFPLGGYLQSITLLPGMKVSKGQPLAVLEDPVYITLQEDFLVGSAKLEQLKKEYERQKTLNVSKSTSDKSFEQAYAEYVAQQVTVNALRQKLLLIGITPEKLTAENISRSVSIYSPIDGYVSEVNVNIGEYVNPSDVLFELVNPTDLHIALTVFEKDLPAIQPGQSVKITSPQNPGKVYEAEIILVGKKVNDDRATTVHCHFKSDPAEFLPGMFVNAEIETAHPAACAVPSEAVVRSGDEEFVFVQTGPQQFVQTPIKTGVTDNGWIELAGDDQLCGKSMILKNAWSALMKLQNKAEE